MKLASFVFASLFACLSLAGCSSGTSGSGNGNTACLETSGGFQTCYIYKNLSSAQASVESEACTGSIGTAVSSCPTAELLGCCTATQNGETIETCDYGGDSGVSMTASEAQMSCSQTSGTWSTSQ